jgi:hypothetical protein
VAKQDDCGGDFGGNPTPHFCAICGSVTARWDLVYRRWHCNSCWFNREIQPGTVSDDELIRRWPALAHRLAMYIEG